MLDDKMLAKARLQQQPASAMLIGCGLIMGVATFTAHYEL